MIKSTVITLGLLIMITSFLFVGYTKAQSPFIFGGLILTSQYCTCSGNFLLTVGPPVAGQFLWYPGTPQYREYQLPRPGVWTLGLYVPGGSCLMFVGKGCTTFGFPRGTIGPTVGTSF